MLQGYGGIRLAAASRPDGWSAQAPALSFTVKTSKRKLAEMRPITQLLAVPPGIDLRRNKMLATYLAEGESDGVLDGYKCRIRRPTIIILAAQRRRGQDSCEPEVLTAGVGTDADRTAGSSIGIGRGTGPPLSQIL
jgi:hypothetical protein